MEQKEILAKNLVDYRKSAGLTQLELAEKLNYSDKAVSKWERGESTPDVFVLKEIADLYHISVDSLLKEKSENKLKIILNLPKKRAILSCAATVLVWLIAVFFFFFTTNIFPNFVDTWLFFIYALPITCVVLLVLTAVWGKNLANMIITSLLVWTTLLAIYLSLITFIPNAPHTLWLIFVVGVPAEILIVLLFFYKKIR